MQGSVRKRGKFYHLDIRADGIDIRESTKQTSKRLAERILQAKIQQLTERKHGLRSDRNELVSVFWPKYEAWAVEHFAEHTVFLHRSAWGHLIEFCNPTRLGDVTPEHIENCKRALRKKWKPRTVNNWLRDIQAIYNKAIRKLNCFSGANPVVGIERYRLTRALVEYHSKEDLGKLLDFATAARSKKEAEERICLDERNLEWTILLGGWQGLRKREIVYCRWEWFDWNDGLLRIRELGAVPDFRLKTRQEREFPLFGRVRDALEPFRRDTGFVLASHRVNQGRDRYRFDPKKSLGTALDAVGLDKADPFQRLRQTFINLHMESGKPARLVSQWAGNSPEVIERHYEGRLSFKDDPNCY